VVGTSTIDATGQGAPEIALTTGTESTGLKEMTSEEMTIIEVETITIVVFREETTMIEMIGEVGTRETSQGGERAQEAALTRLEKAGITGTLRGLATKIETTEGAGIETTTIEGTIGETIEVKLETTTDKISIEETTGEMTGEKTEETREETLIALTTTGTTTETTVGHLGTSTKETDLETRVPKIGAISSTKTPAKTAAGTVSLKRPMRTPTSTSRSRGRREGRLWLRGRSPTTIQGTTRNDYY
jgi:hypothetical protein